MRVTPTQWSALISLLDGRQRYPRGSLERLAKKGLVEGDRRRGWALTRRGLEALATLESQQHLECTQAG